MDTQKQPSHHPSKNRKRARILLRVSSDQQLEADGDLTIQRQLVLDYVKDHPDWILDEKEYFEGSNSGYKNAVADREVLQEAYRDAGKHEYDILVAYKDDRIGRRMWEIGGYIMSLKALGVDIYTVKEDCISPESDDIMGQMMLALRYGNAQKSSADTGMRVKDTAKKLVSQGKFMGGKAPYGYQLEYSGEISKHGRLLKHLVVRPEQAEVVKRIYDLSLHRDYGSAKIAGTLNSDGRYKNLAPNDVWKSGMITSILTNPVYAGYTVYNRRERLNGRYRRLDSTEWTLSRKPNPDITIIDEDTWTKVQEKRKKRGNLYTQSPKNKNRTVIKRNDGMLSLVDVMHCGYCGCKMINGSRYNYWTIKGTGERRTSRTAIYKCQNAWQGVPHDTAGQFRADKIEPIVYTPLAELVSRLQKNENIYDHIRKKYREEVQRKEREVTAEQTKLAKIRHNLCIMEEKIPEAVNDEYPLSLEDLIRSIHQQKEKEKAQEILLQQKEDAWQNASVAIKNQENAKRNIPTWQELFLHADAATKRVLVNTLIERIDITRETVVIRFRISPDQ